MFSSNDLISFVFANENDLYYRSDLLKLNLNQHLWHLLHRRFDSVFFLRADGDRLQPWSFGDSKGGACPKFRDNLILGKAEAQLCNWMRDQLRNRAGHTTAIVCSLRDFCRVLSHKQWANPLQKIADDRSRTGILVLTASPVAEDSAELLLTSPVFEYLRETAITELRGGEPRELYSWIKRRKENSCFFLNEFKWDGIHSILQHLVMEKPQRLESIKQLDILTDYLYQYLNTSFLVGKDMLFGTKLPLYYLSNQQLYGLLKKNEIWDRLLKRAGQSTKNENLPGITPILRRHNSYAGKCMQLVVPDWVDMKSDAGLRECLLLRKIQELAAAPKNKMENIEVQHAANDLLNQLETVPDDDKDAYREILKSLQFCLEWIHMDPNSPKAMQLQEIIQNRNEKIKHLRKKYALEKELHQLLMHPSKQELYKKVVESKKGDLIAEDKILDTYDTIIQRGVWQLSVSDKDDLVEQMAELSEKLEGQDKKIQAVWAEQEEVAEYTPREAYVSDLDLEIRPEDGEYIPPG